LLSSGSWLDIQPSFAPGQQYWITNTLQITARCAPVPGFRLNAFTTRTHERCQGIICDSQPSRTGLSSAQDS